MAIWALRALVLDLDGTLYRNGPLRRAMASRLAANLIRRPSAGWRTLRLLRAYRAAQERLRHEAAALYEGAQLAEACRNTGADPAWAARVVEQWMEQRPLELVRRHMRTDVTAFLEAARQRGLRLAVFSDYPAEAKLAAMDIRHFFEIVRWAGDPDIAAFKPNPRGLRVILDALNLEPSEALYVGDRVAVDEPAARAAGVRAAIIGRTGPATDDCLHVRSFRELGARLDLA